MTDTPANIIETLRKSFDLTQATDEVLFQIARDMELGKDGTTAYIHDPDPLSHSAQARELHDTGVYGHNQEFFYDILSPYGQLMQPNHPDVTTLYLRLNPDTQTRTVPLSSTASCARRIESRGRGRERFFSERYGVALLNWFAHHGAEKVGVGLQFRRSEHHSLLSPAPDSCILRVTVDKSDKAAMIALDTLAHTANYYGTDRYQPPSSDRNIP